MTLKQSLHILAEKERDKKTCLAGDKCSTSKKMLMQFQYVVNYSECKFCRDKG